ncbi:LOW QUALITY PROTEIN: autophagy-related protein 18g-like [Actinidia eriantha]|uniref:LOW QUALITY PROTEIN: autophagy-related protein 18g-like n=1 Tax=Actinidia eriantha TaxID=165200 RepID=UPI002585F176|nr:LOW QUALITY PROTEIN: autophagy-related protein 18g-like [Actinidia eriantha]
MKKAKSKNSGLLPNSLKIISSCLKTVSTNASTVVRSAGASVAASISSTDDRKDQVTWAGFDKLELGPTAFKQVLLLGYQNGFQVFDVEDASNFSELVSKRDGPVKFLQMLPIPAKSDSDKGFRSSHPLLLVVAGDEVNSLSLGETSGHFGCLGRDGSVEPQSVNCVNSPTAVRFYSLRSNCFVQVLKFRSAVCMVRCSSQIVAVGLATQIYCVDAVTLDNKFSVLTYPVPQFGGQGSVGVNFGYGPMAVGSRWLAYASDNPLTSNTGRLSPKNLTPSPGVSPSTSPGSGSLMARYAMESSKQLATGIINLGDKGYTTLSKYYPDLLSDTSNSPGPSNSGWKVGRLAASEVENAGIVVVKDFISRAVISQFRAHTSPISALCFDPSGTLLVTASVHGNNINIFRIIPSCAQTGSANQTHDWSSAHVHLYKLHRGITTAIIQDICFSHYSQWVAIISNKGTCHVYVLSPFGGDTGFQTLNSHSEDPSLYPVLTLPWWSTSSFLINQHSSPPPPVILSVVSRIKDSNSGLLNSVSNAAASAAGKVSVPSGAVAAIFHNTLSHGFRDVQPRANSLEHLLVYTPSGHVVQYELLPLIGVELSDNGLRTRSSLYTLTQDDELRVKVEPVQWWDVCRRSDWPEREESIGTTFAGQEVAETIGNNSKTNFLEISESVGGKQLLKSDSVKPHERSHWYLSNAEVQINSGRLPIWQKSKIRFYMMSPPRVKGYAGGELEIEQIPFHEVEIKWKDLLPVFDHFHSIESSWNDRGLWGGTYPNASSFGLHHVRDKVTEESVICHSKPASLSSTESSDGGSSRRIENLLDLDQMNAEKPIKPTGNIVNMLEQETRGSVNVESPILKQKSLAFVYLPSEHSKNADSHDFVKTDVPSGRGVIAEAGPTSDACGIRADPIMTADHFDSAMNISAEGSSSSRPENLVDFEPFFQEGYCKSLDLDAAGSSGKQCQRENPEDDDENDELLGGMFSFSEEG